MLDSMVNYFIKTFTGMLLPVTAVLPLILLLIVIAWGWHTIVPSVTTVAALAFGTVGFLLGPLLVPEIDSYRVVELIGAFSAFAIGYFALRWAKDTTWLERTTIGVCSLYVIVCVIALLKLAPNLFPIVNSPWIYAGKVVMRPEVMTDQNFQVFYLFPVVLLLALPYRFIRFLLTIVLTLGGLYILTKLQTRSGALVFAGTLLMCLLAPIWTPSLDRRKLLFVPILVLVGIAISLPRFLDDGGLLLARFASTNYETGYSRLDSFLYLFEHLLNPLWWVPQGYTEFRQLHQTIPHSNVTAMFLEGGIAGLYMWFVVFLFPIMYLIRRLFRKQLNTLATLILIGGISMLIVQLTLNVPFFKQPWLWAGAVMGIFYQVRAIDKLGNAKAVTTPKAGLIYSGIQPSPDNK